MMLITRNTCQYFLLSSLFFLPSYSFSQDDHDRTVGFAVGSSPFDAPTEDAFVADIGPGLDTGCTFNDDPEHPLVISVLVDRAVGPVDGSGYLIDPAAMIAKGVIPAYVEIVMPAYDIDFNGTPPPERDEALLNGESLGLLTGVNGIWKLNSFAVPISKIKFPAPSATPATATNVIQINIDILNTGKWCAAIDWVAINVPIRPIVALIIEPMGVNTIRQNSGSATIDKIFEQTLDADCNLTDVIGPIDQYPFSAAAVPGAAKLQTEIQVCPLGSMSTPEIKAEWEIMPAGLTGTSTWTGLNGDVDLTIPTNVGAYTVDVKYSLDDTTTTDVSRKLFVTKQAPITSGAPRLSWYEKATDWASGESTEAAILPKLLSGLYGYGNANWRYGYNFAAVSKCNWEGLTADPLTCDYADCYVFSDVFENMAKTLGIGGLGVNNPTGVNGSGFVTTGAPSLDSAFPGNARSFGTAIYDRYRFSSHSLRVKGGSYFDATFNGIYPNSTAFIAYNILAPVLFDAGGAYQATDEGAKIYIDPPPSVYDGWGSYQYQLPPLMHAANNQTVAVDLAFTGSFNYQEQDSNADGLFEALSVDVEVELVAPGDYNFYAVLKKGSATIANRPEFESMLPTQASLSAGTGTHTVTLKFSGEQIFRSGLNGSYEFEVYAIGAGGFASTSQVTLAYNHQDYGEFGADITAVSESRVDDNGNGKYEQIMVDVQLTVRSESNYTFDIDLSGADGSLAYSTRAFHLLPGVHTVSLPVSTQPLRRSGVNGPYDGVVGLKDSLGHHLDSFSFNTAAYLVDEFDALLLFNGGFSDSVLDTNGNGLYEHLLIEFSADIAVPGAYVLSAALQQLGGALKVFSDQAVTLDVGVQTLSIDFYGPLIQDLGIDGPIRSQLYCVSQRI